MLNRNSPVPNRRPLQLTPYKLKCEKEPLSGRIGPPDFHPQTPNCPEETLTREYLQTGYKDTVEGIEEAREITLTQVGVFSKPVVQKCKEALKKRLKAINESRALKRKAGQVYGVPLSGQLLTRPGIYPEQRPYGEESRKRWIEGLSQPNKRLRSLADHVPHGFKRNALLEVLIQHNVPLLRATWFIKVNILNQSKSDKTQSNRTEQWTKIVIENLKCLLDYFLSNAQMREQSPQQALSVVSDGEGHLMNSQWWYMVRMLQWHFSEGLLFPAPILEWVFAQIQEKDSVEALELLLPIVVNVIEKVALSQHYVGLFFDIAMRQIKTMNSGVADKDLPYDYSRRRSQLSSTLSEMLRYLILSVPDTFVATDAFTPDIFDGKKSSVKVPDTLRHVVSSLHRRVCHLSRVASPNPEGYSLAKVIEKLDKSMIQGDVQGAYNCLFEDLSGTIKEERWIKEISPCLWSSLKWIGTVSLSTICAVFFLCEWATCDHRDYRDLSPRDVKFTGSKDLSKVYFSVSVLKMRRQLKQKPSMNATVTSDLMESPGPLHDIIYCWLDQHESGKAEGFKILQVLILELITCGLFHPHAYVRQLMVSGVMDGNKNRRNHYQILKQLPGSYLLDVLKDANFDAPVLHEAVYVYSNERRLLLQWGSHLLKSENASASSHSPDKVKNQLPRPKESQKNYNSPLYLKLTRSKDPVSELKNAIMALLHISKSPSSDSNGIEHHLKRSIVRMDGADAVKMSKLSEERGSPSSGNSSYIYDDEESWWTRKGSKSVENMKSELTNQKFAKHASRGRRKTQSLAQLATARIEGSQGASTSHVCESKVSCISKKSALDGDISRSFEGVRTMVANLRDIGRALKQLRLLERKSAIIWLFSLIKLLTENSEKSFVKQANIEEGTVVRWKLGEQELSCVLYLFDVSSDWLSSVRFLLWLSPMVSDGSIPPALAGRNSMILPKNKDNQVVDIGEAFFWSCLQRYESILAAAEILPEALTAAIQRATSAIPSSCRSSGSSALSFVRRILKKYGQVPGVMAWEKNLRTTCDPRVLSDIDSGRSSDSDLGFSSGIEDGDDYIRQKMAGNGRNPRAGMGMKEVVHRHVEEALLFSHGRENNNLIVETTERWSDDAYVAQKIVLGLMECIRKNGSEIDPFLISSAVSAIVGNVGSAIFNGNYQNLCVPESSLSYLQRIVRIHLSCLCLLKDTLGDKASRTFELTIASESSSIVSWVFSPGKFPPRSQFQQPMETYDTINPNNQSAEVSNSSVLAARAVRAAAAVSSLVIGALVEGVSTLERMITVFRLKEGLDIQQFIRSSRSSMNGIPRSNNSNHKIFKLDHGIEREYIHWFRVLVGNFCSVFDGLIAEITDESYISAFSRIQSMVPLTVIFPPAYSLFAHVVWRPNVLANSNPTREETQSFQYLASATDEAIKHHPFRDSFFRDTHVLYELLASDSGDSEFAAIFDLHGQEKHHKTRTFLPLRARLFLNAIIDCKLPSLSSNQQGDQRTLESETKLLDELVHVLDTLHPAKFHWQWVMVRLLLNEQALIEKMETRGMSLSEAIRSLYMNTENLTLSENESSFTEIVLTRLLVRPDAASLYSDILQLLGRSLEEKLLLLVKWFLGGNDVLLGRKSISQRLLTFAQPKGVSTKVKLSQPWGWSNYDFDDKRKSEVLALEEGEVVDEVAEVKRQGRSNSTSLPSDVDFITEKALAELVLPCIDRSSNDARDTLASELIKQMCLVDQYINSLLSNSLLENSSGKGTNRKSIQGGSPGMGRRLSGNTDSAPPSVSALRASMWLRLQFILRSLPNIYTDRDPSVRNMKHTLASVLLHLLGTRVVYEDADVAFFPSTRTVKRQAESSTDPVPVTSLDCSGDSLFDMFLSVFHALLSGCKPSWLKLGSSSKSLTKAVRDFSTIDRDFAENLQAELDQMHLPMNIRKRIQAAIPTLPSPLSLSISCHPPTLSSNLLSTLHAPSSTLSVTPNPTATQRASLSSNRLPLSSTPKSKQLTTQEPDLEVDPWTLLEDGTGSSSTSTNGNTDIGGGDSSNLKACSWLKGTIRVRRNDLTYIGVRDDDS